MVSINRKTISLITKIGLLGILIYSLFYLGKGVAQSIKASNEKVELTRKFEKTTNKINNLKRQTKRVKQKKIDLENKYLKTEQVENKVRDIFKRMSVLDYNLKLVKVEKKCIDNFILVTQLTADSKQGLKAGKGILEYIGNTKHSPKFDSIYYVDYVQQRSKR